MLHRNGTVDTKTSLMWNLPSAAILNKRCWKSRISSPRQPGLSMKIATKTGSLRKKKKTRQTPIRFRIHRIFLVLETKCITNIAHRLLHHFQNEFPIVPHTYYITGFVYTLLNIKLAIHPHSLSVLFHIHTSAYLPQICPINLFGVLDFCKSFNSQSGTRSNNKLANEQLKQSQTTTSTIVITTLINARFNRNSNTDLSQV